jgi:hypothetical protein
MAAVRRASSASNRIKKKDVTSPSVRSTRQPSTIQEMGDTTFGDLTEADDGLFVSYNATTGLFELVDADTILSRSIDDSDLPDTFITQVESEINLGDVTRGDLDGGSF